MKFVRHDQTLTGKAREALEQYIDLMDLEKSKRLPSEPKLAALLGISRGTLRTVLDELATEGRLLRKHGCGTFINATVHPIEDSVFRFIYFKKALEERGYHVEVKTMGTSIESAGEEGAGFLGLRPKDPVAVVKKLFLADGEMAAFCIDYFDRQMITDDQLLELQFSETHIRLFLFEKTGRRPEWDNSTVYAVKSDFCADLKPYLTGDSTPLVLLKSVCFDDHGMPMTYAHIYTDSRFIEYKIVRKMT